MGKTLTLRVKYQIVISDGIVEVQVYDGMTIGDIRQIVREQIQSDRSYEPTAEWDVVWEHATMTEGPES